ncbi:helix-turn-helix domain-containing protein [Roseateles cellulosilyticus]|uniref:Helix-turn-helix domain-containing protein n=1 Tax=Pelomonas cellulosilytica TaxID=2906762 RepID=A0ABS8XS81_9BURK|nr:helix-turn-helix domain-containing protein [Pelomonas sp. P8]MCE4553696.1 helix-turn-helix domain-containing protein [Pelomonas sp. P8]
MRTPPAPRPHQLDAYVVDTLMADLCGHDRRPSAFLVYLCLACEAQRRRQDAVPLSLQEIATRTGLAKSTVQAAVRHLKRRGLLDADVEATTTAPLRRVVAPWRSG